MLSRIGGEEFLLLLPNTAIPGATLAMERLRRKLRKGAPLRERPEFNYTFSAGLTEVRAGDTDESLIHRADAALYCAKQAGRNRHAIG